MKRWDTTTTSVPVRPVFGLGIGRCGGIRFHLVVAVVVVVMGSQWCGRGGTLRIGFHWVLGKSPAGVHPAREACSCCGAIQRGTLPLV